MSAYRRYHGLCHSLPGNSDASSDTVHRAGSNTKSGRVHYGTGGWFHTGDQGFLDGDGFLTLTGRLKELINRGGEKISPIEVRKPVHLMLMWLFGPPALTPIVNRIIMCKPPAVVNDIQALQCQGAGSPGSSDVDKEPDTRGSAYQQVDGALLAHPLVAEAVAFGAPDEKYGEVVAAAVVLSKPVDDEAAAVKDIRAQTAKRLASFKVLIAAVCSAADALGLVHAMAAQQPALSLPHLTVTDTSNPHGQAAACVP
jgi:acyl-CoA synthetase (AMP-forming)/AMP-acid ligase II